MKTAHWVSKSPAETEMYAAALASLSRPGDLITLSGPLGAGKTVFARGFMAGLGICEEVPSPTFTLVQTYAAPNGFEVAHFDLYRLESPDDVWELGWEDARLSAITLVEWPERLSTALLPPDRLAISLQAQAEERIIRALPYGQWKERRGVWGEME